MNKKSKKVFVWGVLCLLCLLATVLVACTKEQPQNTEDPNNIECVELSKDGLRLTPGEKFTLTLKVNPSGVAYTSASWNTDNNAVATVSNGVVTAVSVGTAKITATITYEDKTFSDTCTVTVYKEEGPVIKPMYVECSPAALALGVGKTETLHFSVKPDGAAYSTVLWNTDNSAVATVSNGVVTAVSVGTAKITVTVEYDKQSFSSTSIVTVKEAAREVILDKNSVVLGDGKNIALKAELAPEGCLDDTIRYESVDTEVAVVDAQGVVRAVGKGETTVRAYISQEVYGTCSVRVGYRVNVTKEGEGTLRGTEGLYFAGERTTVYATPSFGYVFEGWYEGEEKVGTAASYTYTFSEGDGALTVKFIPDPNMPPVDGTGVYEISTREQLNWAARNNTLDYRLMNDIAVGGYFSLRGYSGTFDGNGHKLTGLTFNYDQSFITCLTGKVKDLTLENVTANSAPYVKDSALFALESEGGVVENVRVTGSMRGVGSTRMAYTNVHVGGLIAYAKNTVVTNCTAEVSYKGSAGYVGGLIGRADGCAITGCLANVDLTWTGFRSLQLGGLVGYADKNTKISQCGTDGTIQATVNWADLDNGGYIGGFIGNNRGNISNSFTAADVSCEIKPEMFPYTVSGFAGSNYQGKIEKSLAAGTASAIYVGEPYTTNPFSTGEKSETYVTGTPGKGDLVAETVDEAFLTGTLGFEERLTSFVLSVLGAK